MKLPILPTIALIAVGLATACGSSSSNSSDTSTASTPASSGGAYGKTASTPAPAASGAVSIKTGSGKPGTFLVDSQGRALYLWQADKSTQSTCSGACAQAWPPLTTSGTPKVASGAKASLLGTTKRSDGTMQVTYDGHPLYLFSGDTGAGQTNGQGSKAFGADWYVVAPGGKALDED